MAGVGTPGVGIGVPNALEVGEGAGAIPVANVDRGVAVVSFITSGVGEGANVGEGITVVAGAGEGEGVNVTVGVGVGVIEGAGIGDTMITDIMIVELGSGLKDPE